MSIHDSRSSSDSSQTLPLRGPVAVPEPPADAPPGYLLLDVLGRGGMGIVVRARQLALDRIVALKLVRGDTAGDTDSLARFRLEAEAVAQLRHPGIVQIYDVGHWRTTPYLAMEFVDGGTLARRLDAGPLPPFDAAKLVEWLARAIDHAHTCGIIHRDLKPGNVLVGAAGAAGGNNSIQRASVTAPLNRPASGTMGHDWSGVKITDFGLAKRFTENTSNTQTGQMLGTPSYMAPEQVVGGPQGPATDVYALGAILYECLTGRPPFQAASSIETLELVRHVEPVAPRHLQPRVPRDLETICLKCLAKQPRHRYASAAELADDLGRFIAGEPIRARAIGWLEWVWKFVRRRPAASALILVSVLAAVGLVAGTAYHTMTLRRALDAESAARAEAARQAQQARERFDLALDAQKMVVAEVRRLSANPATRAAQAQLLDAAVRGLNAIANSYATAEPDRHRISAETSLAALYLDVGRPVEARKHIDSALTIAEKLAEQDSDNLDIVRPHTAVLNVAIQWAMAKNDLSEAELWAEQLANLTEKMLQLDLKDRFTRESYARCMAQTIRVYCWQRRVDQAQPLTDRLIARAREWHQSEPENNPYMHALSIALDCVSSVADLRGDAETSHAAVAEALPIARKLATAEPGNRTLQRSVIVHAGNLGDIALAQHQGREARAYCSEALAIARKLARADPESLHHLTDLTMAISAMGAVHVLELDPVAALACFQEVEDLLKKHAESGKLVHRPFLAHELRPKNSQSLAHIQRIVRSLDDDTLFATLTGVDRADAEVQRVGALVRARRPFDSALTSMISAGNDSDAARLHVAQLCGQLCIVFPDRADVVRPTTAAAIALLQDMNNRPARAVLESRAFLQPFVKHPDWHRLFDKSPRP